MHDTCSLRHLPNPQGIVFVLMFEKLLLMDCFFFPLLTWGGGARTEVVGTRGGQAY